MWRWVKYWLVLVVMTSGMFILSAEAQTKQTKSTKHKTTTTKAKKAAPVKEVKLVLENGCERTIGIYTGTKLGLRDAKLREVGGLGKVELYVKTNEVVCVMKDNKHVIACTNVSAATTKVRVSDTGTNISVVK